MMDSIWVILLVTLVVQNEAALLPTAQSLSKTKGTIEGSLQSIKESHLVLRSEIERLAETIKSIQNEAETQIANTNVCSEGVTEGAILSAEASQCVATVVAQGILDQAVTQMHCIEAVANYGERFAVLLQDLAQCKVDAECHAEVASEAVEYEATNLPLVNQKLNHVWRLEDMVNDGVGGCMMTFTEGIQNVNEKLCSAESANLVRNSE